MLFRLMLVTDRTLVAPGALPNAVDQAIAGGIDAVQLREKDLPEPELIALGRELRAVTRGRALLVVNGTPAQARACDADGVHLPEAAPLPERAAQSGLLLGRSAHDLSAAQKAATEGADYIVLGTIFPSRSHPGGQTSGPELVRRVSAVVSTPLVAIGGITAENAREVVRAGAAGVAVISAILGAPDPRGAAVRLRAAIDGALAAPAGAPR